MRQGDIALIRKVQADTSVLFELMGERYERLSTLIIANQAFSTMTLEPGEFIRRFLLHVIPCLHTAIAALDAQTQVQHPVLRAAREIRDSRGAEASLSQTGAAAPWHDLLQKRH